jgi:REP element-mobilizing transposase RayT
MSRPPRHTTAGLVYHVISRFVDRDWFITSEEERTVYLSMFAEAVVKSDWRCLSYGVMSNHIHLAFLAGEQKLSWLRDAHAPFANWMNERHDRIGPLFVRGPKDRPVEPGNVAKVIAYIHNNPVRAKVVSSADQSNWTSHRAYLGLVRAPAWLHVDEGMRLMGFADGHAFDQWTREPGNDRWEEGEQEPVPPKLLPCPRPFLGPRLVEVVAQELGISTSQLCSKRRGPVERLGREATVRCATQLGLTETDVARALNVTQQAVSLIVRREGDGPINQLVERVLVLVDRAA